MKKVKADALKYYKRWSKEETYCPAFKENIIVSLKGWRHITGATGDTKRNFNDVYRRLKLLPYAKKIIKGSSTIQNIRKKKGVTFYTLEAMVAVKEKGKTAPRKVRVILLEEKNGTKTFLSVMDKKSRRRRKKKKPRRASKK